MMRLDRTSSRIPSPPALSQREREENELDLECILELASST